MEENTKIMVWNILGFNLGKFIVTVPDELQTPEWSIFPYRGSNEIALLRTIEQVNPDIFVVLEVRSDTGKVGTLITGEGQAGLFKLLTDLRRSHQDWCLVPAPRLKSKSPGEGIGVFYRNSRVRFTGPQRWPANGNDDSVAVASGSPSGDYPDPWRQCLPLEEQKMAAHVAFRDGSNNLVGFPQRGDRNPMFTSFVERHHGERTINLVSVHLPPIKTKKNSKGKAINPKGDVAKSALQKIWLQVPGIRNPAPKTVTVVAGDFNLNRNLAHIQEGLFAATLTAPEEWLFDAPKSSMYQQREAATPNAYLGPALNDNGILRYAPGERPISLRGFVGDIAAGAADVVPGTDPASYPAVPETLSAPLFLLQNDLFPFSDLDTIFREPENYGHVGHFMGISNHRPIYLEA